MRTIIAMAKGLSLAVTSEGVETADQLTQLQAMGCDRGQGYYFSPALPPEAFTAAFWHETERRLHAAPGKSTSAA